MEGAPKQDFRTRANECFRQLNKYGIGINTPDLPEEKKRLSPETEEAYVQELERIVEEVGAAYIAFQNAKREAKSRIIPIYNTILEDTGNA